jgi:hypothetical protein
VDDLAGAHGTGERRRERSRKSDTGASESAGGIVLDYVEQDPDDDARGGFGGPNSRLGGIMPLQVPDMNLTVTSRRPIRTSCQVTLSTVAGLARGLTGRVRDATGAVLTGVYGPAAIVITVPLLSGFRPISRLALKISVALR